MGTCEFVASLVYRTNSRTTKTIKGNCLKKPQTITTSNKPKRTRQKWTTLYLREREHSFSGTLIKQQWARIVSIEHRSRGGKRAGEG